MPLITPSPPPPPPTEPFPLCRPASEQVLVTMTTMSENNYKMYMFRKFGAALFNMRAYFRQRCILNLCNSHRTHATRGTYRPPAQPPGYSGTQINGGNPGSPFAYQHSSREKKKRKKEKIFQTPWHFILTRPSSAAIFHIIHCYSIGAGLDLIRQHTVVPTFFLHSHVSIGN